MKIGQSTSVYIDYAKCIIVLEKFGAYVVVAKTGDLDDIPWTQERIQANAQMSGNFQERIDSQERFTSVERFALQASQEKFAPQASQERFARKDELASQESNATSRKCPEEVTNGEGR